MAVRGKRWSACDVDMEPSSQAQTSSADTNAQEDSFFINPFTIPCYGTAVGFGTVTGLAAGLHRYRANGGLAVKAADTAVKFFVASTLVSYMTCRKQHYDDRAAASKEDKRAAMTDEELAAWERQRGIEYGGPSSQIEFQQQESRGGDEA